MEDVIVLKKKEVIMIVSDNSKLIIDKNNKLFNELNKLSKEKIKEWYVELHKGGEIKVEQ